MKKIDQLAVIWTYRISVLRSCCRCESVRCIRERERERTTYLVWVEIEERNTNEKIKTNQTKSTISFRVDNPF